METELVPANPYQEENEEEAVDALSVAGLAPEIVFERDDLINALDLRSSAYQKRAIEIILSQSVSTELKQALAEWAVSHFSRDVLLADFSREKMGLFNSIVNNPQAYAQSKAELDLDIKLLSACNCDTNQPWYGSLRDDLMFVLTAYISRTSGPHRERLENSTMTAKSEITSITGKRDLTQTAPKKKSRWL